MQKELVLELKRNLYRQSYFEFFKEAVKVLEPQTEFSYNFHHKLLCDLLENEARRITSKKKKTTDYNINIPPRSSKSLICSIVFNAWVWGCLNPNMNLMYIGHTEALALNQAQKAKDLIESSWYRELFPDLFIKDDVSAKGYYQNNFGGIRMSFSVWGGITGEGADMILIDDLLKPQEAHGVMLQSSLNTYKEVIYNRVNNPKVGVRFIIGQRVALDDLSGVIINSEDSSYTNISLPAEEGDNISPKNLREYYQDGLFWSDRFDWDVIQDLKKSTGIGEYNYQCQYNQNPIAVSNGMIKRDWFEIVIKHQLA